MLLVETPPYAVNCRDGKRAWSALVSCTVADLCGRLSVHCIHRGHFPGQLSVVSSNSLALRTVKVAPCISPTKRYTTIRNRARRQVVFSVRETRAQDFEIGGRRCRTSRTDRQQCRVVAEQQKRIASASSCYGTSAKLACTQLGKLEGVGRAEREVEWTEMRKTSCRRLASLRY